MSLRKDMQTRMIWQQSGARETQTPWAQSTVLTGVDTTSNIKRGIPKLLHVLHFSWGQGWGAGLGRGQAFMPQNSSLKWCWKDEHKAGAIHRHKEALWTALAMLMRWVRNHRSCVPSITTVPIRNMVAGQPHTLGTALFRHNKTWGIS